MSRGDLICSLHSFLAYFGFVLFMLQATSSYPNGAGTCVTSDVLRMREGTTIASGAPRHVFRITPPAFIPGQTHTITIVGGSFKGLLLWVSDANDNRIGTFTETNKVQRMDCDSHGQSQNGYHTITHKRDVNFGTDSTFTWTAPASIATNTIKIAGATLQSSKFTIPVVLTVHQGTLSPTLRPTTLPTRNPTTRPTRNPTKNPTMFPTRNPTTTGPTANPVTRTPTVNGETFQPTISPTRKPTRNPTTKPTRNPTRNPSKNPTAVPTQSPTHEPTSNPTKFVKWVPNVCTSNRLRLAWNGISVLAETNSTHIFMSMRGPLNKWFAIGWGSKMVGSSALVYSRGMSGLLRPALNEFYLGGTKVGDIDQAKSDGFIIVEEKKLSSFQSICVYRTLTPPSGSAKNSPDFSVYGGGARRRMNIIWASGSNMNFQYHGDATRGTGSLGFNGLSSLNSANVLSVRCFVLTFVLFIVVTVV